MSGVRPIAVGSMRLTEIATMLTDFLIAGICVGLALAMMRAAQPASEIVRQIWAGSFATTAVAAGIGGVVHGFALHLSPRTKQWLWKATQYVLGLTSLAVLGAAIIAFVDGRTQNWLLGVAVAKFIAYVGVVRRRDDYTIVVIDYGTSMIGLVALAAIGWAREGTPASPWLVAAVLVSAVAAIIQLRKIAPHPRFNHNDLYHVVQIVALYLFYRGGLLLVDR